MYRYLFGPVPSRRLGISLGIDLVPMKTCTLDCIYCECGKTTDLCVARREYVPFKSVKTEFDHYRANNPKPDYITFSGSGEPTLNSRIGDVLHYIQSRAEKIPAAVLTNGTLLFDQQVRDDIIAADVVMPSLDAATATVFRKINRPHRSLQIEKIIAGLCQFRRQYRGQIWLEVFIIPGLNDTASELQALKAAIERIAPDRIQLNTLDRPGTVSSIRAATPGELKDILTLWDLPNTEIIAKPPDRKKVLSFRRDIESAILETIARRPCTLADLSAILGLHVNEINKYLDVLEADGKICVVKQQRGFFYQVNAAANDLT